MNAGTIESVVTPRRKGRFKICYPFPKLPSEYQIENILPILIIPHIKKFLLVYVLQNFGFLRGPLKMKHVNTFNYQT